MAEPFKPRILLALASAKRRALLTGYLAAVALPIAAFALGQPWLWAVVVAVAIIAGWFALQCFVELVRVIVEVLIPQ